MSVLPAVLYNWVNAETSVEATCIINSDLQIPINTNVDYSWLKQSRKF